MRIRFNPQPDITVYELALIYGNLAAGDGHPPNKVTLNVSNEAWDTIGSTKGVNLQRHFEVLPDVAVAA